MKQLYNINIRCNADKLTTGLDKTSDRLLWLQLQYRILYYIYIIFYDIFYIINIITNKT